MKTCVVCEIQKEKNNFLKFIKTCNDCIELNLVRCNGECKKVLDKSFFKYGRKICNECYKKKDRNRYTPIKNKITLKQLKKLLKDCNTLENLEEIKKLL